LAEDGNCFSGGMTTGRGWKLLQQWYGYWQRMETTSEVVCSKTLAMMTDQLTQAEVHKPLDPATYTVSYCTTQYISIQSNLKLSS
jgi:hypothetical protein